MFGSLEMGRTKKGTRTGPLCTVTGVLRHRVESLLEAASVALLGLRQGLEPVGNLAEAFLARRAGHARVHVGVLVRLACDRGLEVVAGLADRQAGRRVAAHLEELEMAVRMAGLALGGRAEDHGDVVVAFDVGLLCEIEVAAVGLALAGKRRLQIVFGLGSLEVRHLVLLENARRKLGRRRRAVKQFRIFLRSENDSQNRLAANAYRRTRTITSTRETLVPLGGAGRPATVTSSDEKSCSSLSVSTKKWWWWPVLVSK